jgi:nicotinate dehydrogenase subunit A
MAVSKALTVNGQQVEISIDDPDMPLLYALRDNLGLHGPRFGCGLGQCGACTVHIDGKAVRSCVMPLSKLKPGDRVVTLEGLAARKTRIRCKRPSSTSRPSSAATASTA